MPQRSSAMQAAFNDPWPSWALHLVSRVFRTLKVVRLSRVHCQSVGFLGPLKWCETPESSTARLGIPGQFNWCKAPESARLQNPLGPHALAACRTDGRDARQYPAAGVPRVRRLHGHDARAAPHAALPGKHETVSIHVIYLLSHMPCIHSYIWVCHMRQLHEHGHTITN